MNQRWKSVCAALFKAAVSAGRTQTRAGQSSSTSRLSVFVIEKKTNRNDDGIPIGLLPSHGSGMV